MLAVARTSKRDKPEPLIRQVVAENVAGLRDKVFSGSDTAKNKKLAEAAQTTLSQIQRMLACEVGTSIDLLARLSRPLSCRPQDLLTPYFSLSGAKSAPLEEPPNLGGPQRGFAGR